MRQLEPNQAIRLRNTTCPYCGVALTSENRTKEHVIGRRFVPKGTLDGNWNLIVWACKACNNHKADLEDDLSAISMHSDLVSGHSRDDPRLYTDSERKSAGSFSRKTGKPVSESREEHSISGDLFGAQLKVTYVSAPQADHDRVLELARLQLMAFYYFITIPENGENGGYWIGRFMPLEPVRAPDWGNERQLFFMQETNDWDWRVHAITADGYFKLTLKKHPLEQIWSFAIEWNDSFRIVGFFGDESCLSALRERIPVLAMDTIYQRDNERIRQRIEVPISSADDILFDPPPSLEG
ncbi:MAG: hypothetical protein AAF559_12640 [Pseudomonadota bacterium]